MEATELSKRPVYSIGSGPATGPMAGLLIAEQMGVNNVIVMDMSGTSFDVSLVRDGVISITRATMLGDVPLGIASVEVNSIGAGGGSIARVDQGGLLHVGPQSAGAVPGPACYGHGGKEPTVTDANVVLGYINPEYFLGGRTRLDPKLAQKVIEEKVAKPLNIGLIQAAHGMIKLVNRNMVGAMADITIRHGIDPREFLLIGGGGAGPLHIARLAQELGIKKILIPKAARILCALGMLMADIRFDNIGLCFTDSSRFDYDSVNSLLRSLRKVGESQLERSMIAPENRGFKYFTEARYPFQVFEIEVSLRSDQITPDTLPQLVEDFHATHERRYTFREHDQRVEFMHWKVTAFGIIPKIRLAEQPYSGNDSSHAVKGKRKAYFEELGGFVEIPLYNGDKLAHGAKINGPAIIEEALTTVVLIPESRVSVTKYGDYFMQLT